MSETALNHIKALIMVAPPGSLLHRALRRDGFPDGTLFPSDGTFVIYHGYVNDRRMGRPHHGVGIVFDGVAIGGAPCRGSLPQMPEQ
jgi:hypothetical protein